ncbi:MAG TPA: iron-sulfur cluster repair di-iron protein [Gaiellaceae bacterium]|nr:iron-sulfur cluster repair di-iron protein [Gaiellaceae bacterium]
MTTIDPQTSLGDLVLDEPGRAELFERLGFDYCCGGSRTLAEACAQRGLDVETVAAVLDVHRAAGPPAEHAHDWRRATTADLCDHIVQAHHDRLRRELPVLSETLATVARVHGPREPELHDLARVFEGLRRELEEHIEHEEQVLFPACRELEGAAAPAAAAALLEELRDDHAQVGETLLVLRDLAGGYRAERGRCGTYRALLDGLRELERDLHQHIHEENNVLFPRIRGLLAA